MPKRINDMELRESFRNSNEKYWFSFIAEVLEEADYSQVDLKLTVKNGKVVNIKTNTEKNFNIGGK